MKHWSDIRAAMFERMRWDSLWIYELIADKTLMLTRQAHWRRA